MLNNSLNIKVRGKKKDEILVSSMNLAECTVGFVVIVVFGFLLGQKTSAILCSYIMSFFIYGFYSMITQKYMQKLNMRN